MLARHPFTGGRDKCAGGQFLAGPPGSDEWTRRFLVRRSSRKVEEMRAAHLVTLAFNTPLATATSPWVAARRSTRIRGNADNVVEGLGCSFPPGFADANMIVIQVDIDRMKSTSGPHTGTVRRRTNAAGASTCRVLAFRTGLVGRPKY